MECTAQQIAAATAPPAALGQGKGAEEAAADGLDEDQEEAEGMSDDGLARLTFF
jgi:ribosomal protein L12E/L44/L45/RPP1/RPP2